MQSRGGTYCDILNEGAVALMLILQPDISVGPQEEVDGSVSFRQNKEGVNG